MKKKTIYRILIVIVIVLIAGGVYVYDTFQAMGLQAVYVDETNTAVVPEVGTGLHALKHGVSDWLNWRGPEFSGKSSMTGLKTDWSNGLTKLWEVDYLCSGKESLTWAAPVIKGNHLLIPGRTPSHDQLFCLDAASGELFWKTEIACEPGDSWGTGARATPTIVDSLVYSFGRSGILACWMLEDGKLVWKKDVMEDGGKTPEWGHTSPPLILGNKVIVQGGGEARLIAYDRFTGDVIWKTPGLEAGYAATIPTELDGEVILLNFHGTGLAAVRYDDGKQLWSAPWETSYFVNCNTPIVRNDSVFITSGYNMGGELLKISLSGYQVIWENKVIASHLSDQILLGDYLYGYTKNAGNRGPFACVDFASGEEIWSTKDIGGGSIVWVDDHLIALGVKGDLYLIKPNEKEFILQGTLEDAIPEVSKSAWTPPVVSNGRLYLRYLHKLVCYDISG